MDFPSLVSIAELGEIRERGYDFGGHKPSVNPINDSLIDS